MRLLGRSAFGQVVISPLGEVTAESLDPAVATAWTVLAAASTGISAYHGYKRNDSVGWAIVWGLLGGMFPIIVPAVALAEGFAKPKGR